MLPIGRLSRDSAVFRKEGDEGVLVRKLVMGELPHLHSYRFDGIPERGWEGERLEGMHAVSFIRDCIATQRFALTM